MKNSIVFLTVSVLLNACGSAPGIVTVPATSTVASPQASPSPAAITATLKSKESCTETGSFTETSVVSFAYTVQLVMKNYSDGSTVSTCTFTSITETTLNVGTTILSIASSGTGSGPSYTIGINGLTCPANAAYSFNVPANASIGFAAMTIAGTIKASNCTVATF